MKILSTSQIREADKYTIEHDNIASIDLMERAASLCSEWIMNHFSNDHSFTFLCGMGNNGGDGLAIARHLKTNQYHVKVYIINHTSDFSADCEINKSKFEELAPTAIEVIKNANEIKLKQGKQIIIDALLGTGINKALNGLIKEVVLYTNNLNLPVISIDIPTGLNGDEPLKNEPSEVIINASHTLTFHCPKYSFLFSECARYVNDFTVLDIGLNKTFTETQTSKNHFIIKPEIAQLLHSRSKFSHKGTYGNALMVAGSEGKMGAAVLASKALLKSGVGLLTVNIPNRGHDVLLKELPEAMVICDENTDYISQAITIDKFNAIGVGPGIGTDKQTANVLKLIIQNSKIPLVLDADALNIISENKTWLSFLPAGSILTPHPKEFERLTEKSTHSIERIELLKQLATKHNLYVVLKGAHSCIACPDGNLYFNSTGNPGMAKGGSGDVLTGMITSFVCQGYNPKEACLIGVFLHGMAGDIAAQELTQQAMIPSDIINSLSKVFKLLSL